MSRRLPIRLGAATLACAAFACAWLAGADARAENEGRAASPADQARDLFERGVEAHDRGDIRGAEALFARAWSLQRSWDIAANLGIVEHELGKHIAAAEHLTYAMKGLPPSEAEDTRAGLEQELAKALSLVARITVRSSVAGAEVRVGGELRGMTPLDGPVFVAPGVVLVEASKDGYERALRYVAATAGASVEVALAPALKPRARDLTWTGPTVAFGVGGLGLVTGVAAGTFAAVRFNDLKTACGDDLTCPRSLRGEAEEGRTAAHVATVGFVVAGLGAAVGLTLLAVPMGRAPARVGLELGPAFVGVKGAF